MPWTIPGILLCLLLRVEWVAAAEQEDPTFAADMAQIRRTRAASIAKLTNLLRQIDLTAVQRREAALLLPLETLSAAISAPSEAAQIPLVSFLQDEVLEKTMYHPNARLTFIFGELAFQLMGANDGLLNSNLIDRTAWIARQTRIFRQVTRWHAAVTEKNAEKPAPSIPLPFTNWEVITSNEYLAAAHGRLS